MARSHGSASLPEVVDRVHALWVWLDGRVVDFPAHARSLLGARVLATVLDLLDLVLQAAYEVRTSATLPALLRQSNQRVFNLVCQVLAQGECPVGIAESRQKIPCIKGGSLCPIFCSNRIFKSIQVGAAVFGEKQFDPFVIHLEVTADKTPVG